MLDSLSSHICMMLLWLCWILSSIDHCPWDYTTISNSIQGHIQRSTQSNHSTETITQSSNIQRFLLHKALLIYAIAGGLSCAIISNLINYCTCCKDLVQEGCLQLMSIMTYYMMTTVVHLGTTCSWFSTILAIGKFSVCKRQKLSRSFEIKKL